MHDTRARFPVRATVIAVVATCWAEKVSCAMGITRKVKQISADSAPLICPDFREREVSFDFRKSELYLKCLKYLRRIQSDCCVYAREFSLLISSTLCTFILADGS